MYLIANAPSMIRNKLKTIRVNTFLGIFRFLYVIRQGLKIMKLANSWV